MKRYYTLILMILSIISICGCTKSQTELLELSEMTQSDNEKLEELVNNYNSNTYKENIVYYDNSLDISYLTDLAFGTDEVYISFNIGGNLDTIVTNCNEFIYPVIDESNITNNDIITIEYVSDNIDDKTRFTVTSYNTNDKNEISYENRKINAFTVHYDNEISIFDTIVNNKINNFIDTIGNPTYKRTNIIKDPYITDVEDTNKEKTLFSYVYECDTFKMILFSYDDITIDKISVEMI